MLPRLAPSTLTQRPTVNTVLPISPPEADAAGDEEDAAALDYIWEPDRDAIFDLLVPLYLRNRVLMTLMEAFTSEHAARMTAMESATRNTEELIRDLTLQFNRARQAAWAFRLQRPPGPGLRLLLQPVYGNSFMKYGIQGPLPQLTLVLSTRMLIRVEMISH